MKSTYVVRLTPALILRAYRLQRELSPKGRTQSNIKLVKEKLLFYYTGHLRDRYVYRSLNPKVRGPNEIDYYYYEFKLVGGGTLSVQLRALHEVCFRASLYEREALLLPLIQESKEHRDHGDAE